MLTMKRATPADREDVLLLWGEEFGDGGEFIDPFAQWCGWENILLLKEDGRPCALTAIPAMELAFPGGERAKVGYVYAHTTKKEQRGQGFGHILLNYSQFCLEEQGMDGVTLVPARPDLFRYFATSGYSPAFYLTEETVERGNLAAAITPLDPQAYGELREERLAEICHGVLPLGLLEQQESLCLAQGGGLFAVETEGGRACAVVERQADGALFLRELLAPAGWENAAATGLCAALDAPRCTLRRPWRKEDGEENRTPFGAMKWFATPLARRFELPENAYFGLALD